VVERVVELGARGRGAAAHPAGRDRRHAGQLRVWLLTAGLGGAAIGYLTVLPSQAVVGHGTALPWWSLAIAYCLAGVLGVHVRLRRHAHTITLGEVPLVLGLLAASPAALIAGGLVGTALSLTVYRRQSPVKVAFNLALFLVEVDVAITVMRAVLGGRAVESASGWVATLAATLTASVVSTLLVAVAMAVASNRHRFADLPLTLGLALPATLLNTVLGLAGLDVVEHQPLAGFILLIPVVALAVAYRSYLGERQKHVRVRLLYETSRALHRSRGVEVSITTLLGKAREMFNAEVAELILLPTSSTDVARRCTLGPGDDATLAIGGVEGDDPAAQIRNGGPAVLLDRDDPDGILARRGLRDGMAVSISGEGGATGTLIVANRLDSVSVFGRDDLELLEAFAGPASVSLDNGRLQGELEYRAFHDSLTGLPNRALLTQRLQASLVRRRSRSCGILLLDVDDFKAVNDTLGHPAGDQLLIAIAQRLTACLRPGDLPARLGGDEFAVMLDCVDGPEHAMGVAERVLDALRTPFTVSGCDVTAHASIGVVVDHPGVVTVDDLLSSADLAMYRAKARGRNRCVLFEPLMQVEVLARHQLRADLERAVREGGLEVHYQPIVSLQTGAVTGAEALVRWTHPVRGAIGPDEFIPLAEETGLVVPLGCLVLDQACGQLARWSPQLPDLELNVNLSGRQLQAPGIVDEVAGILDRHGIEPRRLTLEVTERAMVDGDDALAALAELRRLGVQIAVDDFGTGFSSLSCLGDLPIDMLKIAKPFVDRLARSDDGRALALTIVGLATSLRLDTVAEGIERPDQAEALRAGGCGGGQGFLFSRALTGDDFLEQVAAPRPPSALSLAG
jgi:diguanylate cyclase (GGDEF)-like protein